jgi:sec-independent protein translocase protein TatB
MFSDIGPLEVVTLIVLAVILVGPDKLPKMVSDTVRSLRKLREFSQSAQASI